MTPERRAALEVAFVATCYRVSTERGCFDLRVGVFHPSFDAFLVDCGVRRWALLTASNPGAVVRSDEENARATKALLARLDSLGWKYYSASYCADRGDWPVEDGVLLLDIGKEMAVRLSAEYCQLACVTGNTGHAPALAWV